MIQSQKVVALAPIKENSERVKGKNFRSFCGRPLYHHIIDTLDRVCAVDEIVVDTDSDRVLREVPSLSGKARVLERPMAIRGDLVSMNRVIEYDLTQTSGDLYLQTHATNPLLKAETIALALREFVQSKEHDSLFTVTSFHSRFYRANGEPVNHDPDQLIRTQDLPPLFEENSCLYLFTKESFAKKGRRIAARPLLYPIPKIEAIDIDDEFTFRLAELLALYAVPGSTSGT